jgi:hypothetical protein
MTLPNSPFTDDAEIQRFLKWLFTYHPEKNAEFFLLALTGDNSVVDCILPLLEQFRREPNLPPKQQN